MKSFQVSGRHAFFVTALTLWFTQLCLGKEWDNGGGDGNWNTPANWSDDTLPSATDAVILDNTYVAGSYSVTINNVAGPTCASIQIGYAGNPNTITLLVPSANTQSTALTIPDAGSPTETFIVHQGGRFENLSGAASGNVVENLQANSMSVVKAGGYFLHNTVRPFNTPFPATGNGAITLESGSTIEFGQNTTTSNPLFTNRTFGNLAFSASSSKTFNCTTTGPAVIVGTLSTSSNVTLNITAGSTGSVTYQGNISHFGNRIYLRASAAGGSHIFDGAPTNVTGATGAAITPTISGGANPTLIVNTGKTLNITNGTVLEFESTTAVIEGGGSFNIVGNSQIIILHPGGLDGCIVTTGSNSFSTTGNYYYDGGVSQITGASLPGTITTLWSSNTAVSNSLILSNPLVTNSVILASGELVTTSVNTLTTLNVTRSTGYVSGPGFRRTFVAGYTGSRVFHVGTSNGYTPVTLTITSPSPTAGSIGVAAVDGAHPNVPNPLQALDRYWSITPINMAGAVVTLNFTYLDGEVNGTEANYILGRYTGTGWEDYPGTVLNTTSNTASVSGITSFSDWTLGEAGSVPVEISNFGIE